MSSTPAAPERFALTKWYLDCVDADGRVAIGYWASVRLYAVTLTWHSVAFYEPGRPPRERTSLHQVHAPDRHGDTIAWSSAPLGCAFTVRTQGPHASLRLLDDPRGHIDWRCEAPSAHVSVTMLDGEPLHGTGYAECLSMTLLPWQLPIDELRWGRWVSQDASRSVVWIDWRGDVPRRWVLVDGVTCADATLYEDGVSVGNAGLTLRDGRTLHERSLGSITGRIAPLASLLPDSLLALHEHKHCSLGAWREGDVAPATGWAIHELVRFTG